MPCRFGLAGRGDRGQLGVDHGRRGDDRVSVAGEAAAVHRHRVVLWPEEIKVKIIIANSQSVVLAMETYLFLSLDDLMVIFLKHHLKLSWNSFLNLS